MGCRPVPVRSLEGTHNRDGCATSACFCLSPKSGAIADMVVPTLGAISRPSAPQQKTHSITSPARRHIQAEHLGGLDVQGHLKFCRQLNRKIAVVVGDKIVSTPTVRGVIKDGKAKIAPCDDESCQPLLGELSK